MKRTLGVSLLIFFIFIILAPLPTNGGTNLYVRYPPRLPVSHGEEITLSVQVGNYIKDSPDYYVDIGEPKFFWKEDNRVPNSWWDIEIKPVEKDFTTPQGKTFKANFFLPNFNKVQSSEKPEEIPSEYEDYFDKYQRLKQDNWIGVKEVKIKVQPRENIPKETYELKIPFNTKLTSNLENNGAQTIVTPSVGASIELVVRDPPLPIPIWLMILLIVSTVVITVYLYRKVKRGEIKV